MKPNRYDIYRYIHKGLRAYLTDTLLRVGQMDPNASVQVQETLGQLDGLLKFCLSHLQHENEFIHSAMNNRAPGSAEDMYEHHQSHVEMITELNELSDLIQRAPLFQRESLIARLYRTLALFVADNLAHMDEEETLNNRVLWCHYSDDEIRAIEHALVASIPPDDNAEVMHWMLPALNHQERQDFLGQLRDAAPVEVFNTVLDIARSRLTQLEWYKLETELCYPQPLAG